MTADCGRATLPGDESPREGQPWPTSAITGPISIRSGADANLLAGSNGSATCGAARPIDPPPESASPKRSEDYWVNRLEREDRKQDIAAAIEQSERSSEKAIVPANPETASPMHPRDWRLFFYLGIPAALAVTIFGVGLGAFIAGSPHWGFGLCAPSAGVLGVMAVYLLDKKPKTLKPPYPFVALTGIAVLTWIFIGWQTWLFFTRPSRVTRKPS